MVAVLQLPLGATCIKYLMFTFNLLFVITGIIFISIGAVIHGVYGGHSTLLENKFFSLPTFFIVLGAIIFIIAFFGCCGAVRESYCMILTFTAMLIVIFIMELSGGIAGYVLRNDAEELVETKMYSTLQDYIKNDTIAQLMWDGLQRNFSCCGVKNASDWVHANVTELPMSCCRPQTGDFGKSTCNLKSKTLYEKPCLYEFSDYIKLHAVQLGGAGIGIAFVQAVGIWFAIYLARAIKLTYETVR